MQTHSSCASLPLEAISAKDAERPDDRGYQLVTVASMVLLLVTMWIF